MKFFNRVNTCLDNGIGVKETSKGKEKITCLSDKYCFFKQLMSFKGNYCMGQDTRCKKLE